jgi:hypothetical protein
MEIDGVVQNGVIVPQGDCPLAEGTKVRIRPSADTGEGNLPSLADRLRRLAEEAELASCDLPTDLAINHDHYLYGTSRRQP